MMSRMLAAIELLLLAVSQQPGAAPRELQPPRHEAVISGRVTEQGSGRPLRRMVVTLTQVDRSTPLDTLTDGDGRYEFTGVQPGKFSLSAGPGQHCATYLHQRYGTDAPALPHVAPQPNLEVAAGERRTGLDIALWRALAIEGRVVDPGENGMANVAVLVRRIGQPVRPAARAFTDDRGMYRAYGLASGRYRVCAEIKDASDAMLDNARLGSTCYPSAVDEGGAGEIVLTSQDATGIDIRVQPFRSHSITGFVVDAGGSAVNGAFIGAFPLDDRGPSASGTTRRGEFVLNGLAPGRYIVRASLTEPNPGDGPPLRDVEVGYASVDLTGGDAAGLSVWLSKPVDVSGRVTFDGARPPSSRRLGMVVETTPFVERLSFLTFERRPPFSPVGDDLSFELKRLYRLPMVLRITGLPDGWALKSVRYDGRDITYVPTEFSSGPSPGRLELIVTNRVAQPTVRVFDEAGKTITSCHVIAIPADPARWQLPMGFVTVSPEPGGSMKVGPLLPGEYIVAAIPRDEAGILFTDRSRVDALAAIGNRVTLVEGDRRTFDLHLVSVPPKR